MKKQFLMISIAVSAVLLSVGSGFAQDDKKMDMNKMDMMAEMQKSPHHQMMMTHRQSVLHFAKTLRDMAKDSKLADVELARNAFAEIRRGMEKMEEIHQAHSGKMSAEMREKMKPMMEKMQAEKAAMNEHILALEKALQMGAPDAKEVEKHAAALVEQMEKMKMPEMKMDMRDKKKM